jgi:hypothetical protein
MFEISDQTVNNTNSRSEKWRQFLLRPPPGFASILLNICIRQHMYRISKSSEMNILLKF